MIERHVLFAGDLVNGDTVTHGWVDPRWSPYVVHERAADVRPSTPDPDEDDLVEWLAGTVLGTLGSVDNRHDRGVWYAADERHDYRTGRSVRLSAIAKGFTDAELDAADDLIAARSQEGIEVDEGTLGYVLVVDGEFYNPSPLPDHIQAWRAADLDGAS